MRIAGWRHHTQRPPRNNAPAASAELGGATSLRAIAAKLNEAGIPGKAPGRRCLLERIAD